MESTRTPSGRYAWERWYAFRQEARETAMSKEEFSPIEQDKYDLDTAEIDGTENPESFRLDPYGAGEDPIDYREADPRFD